MRRRLFTACAAVSLLLLAAVCGVWVRSHFVIDRVHFATGVGKQRVDYVTAASYAGTCGVSWHRYTFEASERDAFVSRGTPRRVAPGWGWEVIRYDNEGEYQQLRRNTGRGWFHAETKRGAGYWNIGGLLFVQRIVSFPHGIVALALAVCPAIWAYRWRRVRRRSMVGRCPACGYDLRATPERCPECGTVPAASPTGG